MKMIKIFCPVILFLVLSGCSATTHLVKNAESLNMVFDKSAVRACQPLGEVVGSEGHWFNYLFLTNPSMVQGALNDLRNNAQAKGADTIYVWKPLMFVTSFTVLGQAYHCGP